MMPRLTRVGNYYCRQDPPKARVWDDDKKGSNGNVIDCNHVLVTDTHGGILNVKSNTRRKFSFSKSSIKTRSLQSLSRQSFSRQSVKKTLQRSLSMSNPLQKEFI